MNTYVQTLNNLRSIRKGRFFCAAKRAFYNAFYPPYQRTVGRFIEWRFDRKWDVQTSGIVEYPKESENPLHRSAVRYEPTSPQSFRQIMRYLGCLTAPFSFFDIGCGKGRVLLMASEYSFNRIVGIEFSPELSAIAEDNVARLRSRRPSLAPIEVVCMDAAKYEFPDEHAVLFLANPFNEEILSKVLKNIRLSAQKDKARYIVYNNPVLATLLSNPEHFALLVEKRRFSIYRVV